MAARACTEAEPRRSRSWEFESSSWLPPGSESMEPARRTRTSGSAVDHLAYRPDKSRHAVCPSQSCATDRSPGLEADRPLALEPEDAPGVVRRRDFEPHRLDHRARRRHLGGIGFGELPGPQPEAVLEAHPHVA